MKIIVTGGAGFIGSALVRYLINIKGHTVLNIDKLTYAGNLESLRSVSSSSNYHFRQVDISDRSTVGQIIHEFQPERIMHLAAESHVDRSITGSSDFVNTNIVGTYEILEACRHYWQGLAEPLKGAFRFLHVSTDEVYGSLGAEGLFHEETPYDPSSPYSATKAASDHLAKAWFRTYDMPIIVSNCSNNYGPFHFPEKLIPLTVLNALEGKPLTVYGNGENIRDWLYVDDHAIALDLIAEKGRLGETYNVGGRNERANIQVVREICNILDEVAPKAYSHHSLITFVADRPGHDQRYAIDATKLETELGWRAAFNFEAGIKSTVNWYLENEWWWRPLKQIYDGHRLGALAPQSEMAVDQQG